MKVEWEEGDKKLSFLMKNERNWEKFDWNEREFGRIEPGIEWNLLENPWKKSKNLGEN